MIKNLKVDNFKSLRSIDLELRNLNLLTGLNGSGKSSLIQVLLLLRQSKEEVSGDYLDNLYLKGNLISAGVVQDIIYSEYHKMSKNVRITIELLFSKEKDYLKIHSDFIMDLNKESLNISNVHEESNLRIGWLSKHSLFNNLGFNKKSKSIFYHACAFRDKEQMLAQSRASIYDDSLSSDETCLIRA
jgi:predicted ATPase